MGEKNRSVIRRIDKLRPDDKVISSVVLSDWVEIPTGTLVSKRVLRFPKTIRLEDYDPDQPEGQDLVTRVDYAIELLEVGSDFDDDVFEIQGEGAVAVWEKGQLTRQPNP